MATTTVDTSEIASRLRLAIARMARRMRQEAGGGLTASQAAALATVERHGPLTPSELADVERVQRPSATRIIAWLAEAGLVARAPDPSDGRASLVSLTKAGAAELKRLRTRKSAYLARRMRELDAADVAALERAAEVLERMLEGERR
jgi:DNA-binding MarR family transcriptional regulator